MRFTNGRSFLIVLLVFSSLLFLADGLSARNNDRIMIGVTAPMTGTGAQYGLAAKQGIEMAVAEINEAGGVCGKKLEAVYGDDKADPKESSLVASKFCSNRDIMAIIGNYNSSCTIATANYTNRYKVPQVSFGSSSPKITGISPYVFRNMITDVYQGEALAVFVFNTLKKQKVVILHENTDYGVPFAEVFRKKFESLGSKILFVDKYNLGTTIDFSGVLTKIKGMDADCIVVPGLYREASLIAKQAREIGLNAQIVGGDGLFSDKLMELGGSAVEGIAFVGPFHHESTDPVAKKFVAKFRAKYNALPDAWAAQAYDAARIVAEAIARAGKPDRAAIRDELANTKDFDGVTGRTTFDKNGDCIKDPVILTVRDGKIVQFK